MPDFYQILKREVEPLPTSGIAELGEESGKKDRPVDKVGNSSIIAEKKKGNERQKNRKFKKSSRKKNNFLPPLLAKTAGYDSFLSLEPANPIWLTLAEAAKLAGIQKRTVKRALRAGLIKYRIIGSRYQVDFRSTLLYLFSKKKLWRKLQEFGIGQYVEEWKK